MMSFRLVLVALAAAALLPLSAADHCATYTTAQPEVALENHYVDLDACQTGCGPSLRIYEESNGIGGLQRGDDVQDDTCHGMISPDARIL